MYKRQVDDDSVLAAGWTDDPTAVLARLPVGARPSAVEVVAPQHPGLRSVVNAVTDYYDGDLSAIDDVAVRQFGSPWRLAGWCRLREIPPGAPLSYAGLAEALGAPSAVRAAAGICASNAPVSYTHLDPPDQIDPVNRRDLEQRLATANPAQLRRDIDLIQRNLLELARRRGTVLKAAKRNHVYLSRAKITRAKPDESTTQPKRAS